MWYVVGDAFADDKNEAYWTLSQNPNKPGWETDSAQPGYGLTYAQAKTLADAANKAGV